MIFIMDRISDVSLVSVNPLSTSKYISPQQLSYKQAGILKTWDYIQSHDSVGVLLRNTTRDVFVFVRQFRPAVYMHEVEQARKSSNVDVTAVATCTNNVPAHVGITYELCAGIIDKDASPRDTACQEVLEECGYQISADSLEVMFVGRSNVGIAGSMSTAFYAEVTDSMKVSCGGGLAAEGEMIEIAEIPVKDALKFFMQHDIVKPVGVLTALMWFNIYKLPALQS